MAVVEEREMLTPPMLARRWAVDHDKVLGWIRSGELRAINLATSVAGRPRYRISIHEVERFEEARSTKPPAPKPARRRRSRTAGREYF